MLPQKSVFEAAVKSIPEVKATVEVKVKVFKVQVFEVGVFKVEVLGRLSFVRNCFLLFAIVLSCLALCDAASRLATPVRTKADRPLYSPLSPHTKNHCL